MPRHISQQDVTWILDLNTKGQLDLEPRYQRRSVWTPKDKGYFIDTIMSGYPAPAIFMHKSLDDQGHPTYHVVDGKQRLLTIINFAENKIRIPDNYNDVNLQKKFFDDLDREEKYKFWNYTLVVEMLPSTDSATIENTFERINRNNRNLTRQEIRHARYEGWFAKSVEEEAKKNEWQEFGIVTTSSARRMRDVQFISEIFDIVLNEKIIGFDQDYLDELYAKYEEPENPFSEDDFFNKLEKIKNIIKEMIRKEQEITKYIRLSGHFYSLWGFLYLQTNEKFDPSIFAQTYLKFLKNVAVATKANDEEGGHEGITSYERGYSNSFRAATTDLAPRESRHKHLTNAMANLSGVSNENL